MLFFLFKLIVNFIPHRFDDPLKYAIILNTRGTREVIQFAETLSNLSVIVHVSTTYCNLKSKVVKEEVYPPMCDWRSAIKIAETLDPFMLDILGQKFMDFMPNTYTFTKHLSEQIIHDYSSKLPIVLFRPSIVISTMKDPFPGWIDNFNGPVGLLVGCGIGLTRTMYCDPDNVADFTPVDVCIKAMIVGGWKRALDNQNKSRDILPVYNASTSSIRQLSMQGIINAAEVMADEMPLEKMIWAPGGSITTSRLYNFFRTIMLHFIPALFLDLALQFTKQKPL